MTASRAETLVVPFSEIDIDNESELEALLVATDGAGPLILDMSRVRFMGSAGLRALVAAEKHRRAAVGAGLQLVNVGEAVRRVLEITSLERWLSES
jgi:anti-anti-sigma factor